MNLDLDAASEAWMEAKAAEKKAVERRRAIEDHLASLLGVAETLEGTQTTVTDGGHRIKLVGRMSRKVDRHAASDVAAEYGLEAQMDKLFRWKPEINVSAWKAAPESVTRLFLKSITTTPSRVSFSIEKE
jgi:hypothetical protein